MRFLHPWAFTFLLLIPGLVAALLIGRRRKPGIRRVIPLVLRALLVTSLVMVVAGSQARDSSLGVDVVFVVDVSDSIGPMGEASTQLFLREALAGQVEQDRAAIVLVGSDVAVERGLQPGLRSLSQESVIATSGSSLADGILRGLSLFTDLRDRQIILLSDGQETTGDVVHASRIAAEAGVSVSVVPLNTRPSQGEVYLQRIDAPTEVRIDETHEFSVVVTSAEPAAAVVTVFRDGEYFGEDEMMLGPGDNVVSFQGSFATDGVHKYSAIVASPGDPISINNETEAMVRVSGEPKILYLAENPAQQVVAALESQGIDVVVRTIDGMPSDVNELVSFDSVILDNVPAYDMSVPRMEAVERYVRDTGGGLVMLGGDLSFGAGGYYKTPIERALPVDMDVTSSLKIPSLAMIFVIDKSGSMGAVETTGNSKLDLVKEAVISSVEIMNPFYSVGLLAFDADYEWTVPMTRAGDKEAIIRDLSTLESGGGTILEGALIEAHRTLSLEEAAVKHVIILSDGLTSEGDFENIVGDMLAESITLSTVSIGSSSNRQLMKEMAEWGQGRTYHTADSSSVPRIFAAETTIVSRNLIVEETFVPEVASRGPILEGIDIGLIPPLEGFVLSYQKTGSQAVLTGPGLNPVMSTWQYGLGRSVAFTSDFRAKWGINWLDWDQYPKILAQMVRWTQRPVGTSQFQVRFTQGIDDTAVTVDALENDGSFRNLLDLSALTNGPDGTTTETRLVQTAPGRYSATIDTRDEGNYLITVFGDTQNAPQTFGLSVPYAREYIQFEVAYDTLELVARAGGGQVLSPESGSMVFGVSQSGDAFRDALWIWLLIAAVILLLLELLFKKIILPIGSVTSSRRLWSREESTESNEKTATPAGPVHAVPSYADLRKQVATAYMSERQMTRESLSWHQGGEHNPVAERKIYIARKRQR